MYEQLLMKSERCIEQQQDRQLTISSLWEKVKALASKDHFVIPDTMTDFECLLEGDKRFRFSDLKTGDEDRDDSDITDKEFPEFDEIEGLGFDREQKVTLARFFHEEESDESEDEAFAPRPFKKDEETGEGATSAASKKPTTPRVKKAPQKKTSAKRK
jgi:hypothetical protein